MRIVAAAPTTVAATATETAVSGSEEKIAEEFFLWMPRNFMLVGR